MKFLRISYWKKKKPIELKDNFGFTIDTKNTGYHGPSFYEINVSINGKHLFATDSHIRNYSQTQIDNLVQLFKEKFPDCKTEVLLKTTTYEYQTDNSNS